MALEQINSLISKIETVDEKESPSDPSATRILILGCGLSSPPLIEYLNFYGYKIIMSKQSQMR